MVTKDEIILEMKVWQDICKLKKQSYDDKKPFYTLQFWDSVVSLEHSNNDIHSIIWRLYHDIRWRKQSEILREGTSDLIKDYEKLIEEIFRMWDKTDTFNL